jgi:predicted amidohydrolase
MSTQPINVAAVQFEPTMFDKERNIEKLYALVEEAARAGAQLIVAPEMATTGYCWRSREEVAPYVEPIPGPTSERFCGLAKRYGCYIAVGMPEVDPTNDLYYNSAFLVGPEGLVGVHRKTHPYISEPKWAVCGNLEHQVFDTPIGKIALLICMDIHFLEVARVTALAGADVICHLSNWLAERTPAPYWINRAYENGCYLIEGNRWGLERGVQFSGGSCIIEPDGSVQAARDNGDGVVLGSIDLSSSRAERQDRQDQRRPELYKELLNNTYTWNPLDFFALYGQEQLPPGGVVQVGVGQFNPRTDKAENLARITELAHEGLRAGASVLVFPELSLSGPYVGAQMAETLEGPSVIGLIELAKSLDMYLAGGLVEEHQGKLYNSSVLVGPEGLLCSYRKIHLSEQDRRWAEAGEQWCTHDLPFARVGLLIGDDCLVPEAGRILALKGCDLIVCSAALTGPVPGAHAGSLVPQPQPIPMGPDAFHWHLGRVRGGENNLYFVFANSQDATSGTFGASGVFGPDTFAFPRREALVSTAEGIAVSSINTENLASAYATNVVRRKDLVLMRKPHQYRSLIKLPLL